MSPLTKDYYQLIGVDRNAGSDEIKREFRRRAKELHPDSNRGDKKREEKFKALNEAYDVLSDPIKRREYDARAPGPEGATSWESVFNQPKTGPTRPRAQEKPSGGFFEHLFGSSQNHAKANGGAKESYVETEMSISLEEAMKGSSRRIALTIREKSKFGKPRVTEKMLDVKIPAGIREGQKIRLKSPGSSRAAKTEDVFIKIHIAAHPVFEFEGKDLVAPIRVSPWEAALGKNVRVPTLDGTAEIRLPVGISSGQKLRLKGRGFPEMGSGKKGDLFYRIMIVLPQKMTVEEEELFKRFDAVSRFKPREQK